MPIHRTRSPPPPPAKRPKLDLWTENEVVSHSQCVLPQTQEISNTPTIVHPVNYHNGIMLAPMVRSGTLPSRLLALKYGADLVWAPEIVDKAIIGCDRVVDEETGVISYEKSSRQIWSTHPAERPFLIYQIGSSSPSLAVEAALTVAGDVSGVDLNCGCPKPFSTHAGMGANLLTNPDLLCEILTSLRHALPAHIPVTAKIRLLPDQNDTLELIRRIVGTGISALTVHCRTKEMRKTEPALVHRLREIVEFVERMGVGVPVIENGDCLSREDAKRIRDMTGVCSVMLATAAEKNLSCFSSAPLLDAEGVLAPTYLSLARYLKNPWGNSKHCSSQFTSPQDKNGKSKLKELRQTLSQAKGYDAFTDADVSRGEEILKEVEDVVKRRLVLVSERPPIRNTMAVPQTLPPGSPFIAPSERPKELESAL